MVFGKVVCLVKSLLRTIIATLIAIYITTIYFIFNPKVSQEYHDYYIYKSSDLSLALVQALKSNPVQSSTVYDHTSNHLGFTAGWSLPENMHRSTSGKFSRIIFYLDECNCTYKGSLILNIENLGMQHLEIALNGSRIYSDFLEAPDNILSIDFSPPLLKRGKNMLEFHILDARQDANGEQRVLALGFKSLEIR